MTAAQKETPEPFIRTPCDACGEPIGPVSGGWVEWRKDDAGRLHTFRVVHHYAVSRRCVSPSQLVDGDHHLAHFAGPLGLERLASVIWQEEAIDTNSFAHVMLALAEMWRQGVPESRRPWESEEADE